MATTKTVNVTTGKFLNYQITKAGYKPVTGSVFVDSNKTINVNMVSTESQEEVYKLGDRILNMASFVCYYKPGGEYDNKPISTTVIEQTHGSNLTNLGVKKGIFEAQINPTYDKTAGIFVHDFLYNGSNWTYDGNDVNLEDYGIFYNTASSTVSNNDKITVTYTVYNKYAVFILDANYRDYGLFYGQKVKIPNYPTYTTNNSGVGSGTGTWYYGGDGQESATWCNEHILDNSGFTWSNYPAFYRCREIGKFILANGISIYPLVPNETEAYQIYLNKVFLDSIDPVVQSGITERSLVNGSFSRSNSMTTCIEYSADRYCGMYLSGSWSTSIEKNSNSNDRCGFIPVFEVPVM